MSKAFPGIEALNRRRKVRWFVTSPDEGPDCACSWCGKPILDPDDVGEGQPEAGPALRMVAPNTLPPVEARFHYPCLEDAEAQGEVVVPLAKAVPEGGQA